MVYRHTHTRRRCICGRAGSEMRMEKEGRQKKGGEPCREVVRWQRLCETNGCLLWGHGYKRRPLSRMARRRLVSKSDLLLFFDWHETPVPVFFSVRRLLLGLSLFFFEKKREMDLAACRIFVFVFVFLCPSSLSPASIFSTFFMCFFYVFSDLSIAADRQKGKKKVETHKTHCRHDDVVSRSRVMSSSTEE